MEHQDWKTVILTKSKSSTNKTTPINSNHITKKQREIEGNNVLPPVRMTTDMKTSLQKARMAKKMNQKELAQVLGVQQQIIVSYENGKAIPNNQFISKMEKVLNTKLPRVKKQTNKNITEN